ncbi:sensor histidine kinase [Sphingomonas sp.]|uniref:sensor histidine kinase n=1 Tax=Sphingomonas sp. TaxID=28214 RepID=UPI002EDA2585
MSQQGTEKLRFRPRARIIRTIGDQLISGPEAAVIELVKNSYDADASYVTVKFVPPLKPGDGSIVVQDDGHGMTLEDIQEKWMEPATTSKVKNRRSPGKNRVMMGSKGIGRFAAAKLGGRMGLYSISERSGGRREVLIPDLDWSIFSAEAYLDAIAIDYSVQETDADVGTLIEIRELNEEWTKEKLERLHLELRRLVSPFQAPNADTSFDIFLDLSECTKDRCGFDGKEIFTSSNIAGDVAEGRNPFQVLPVPLLTASDYEVRGEFDEQGIFHGTFENRRGGQAPQNITVRVALGDPDENCGRVRVELFIFDREVDAIRSNLEAAGLGTLPAAKARQILDEIAGVSIFREGFRVRPYGDPENDWLTLDTRRVQDPSLRIGHNQIAGYITVGSPEESNLVERSSREGFEQNRAFARLRRLIITLLAEVIEPKRQQFRDKAGIARRKTTSFDEVRKLTDLGRIRRLVAHLEPGERAKAERIIDQQAAQLTEKIDALEERQRLLEAKSSLGAIVGEILHEGAPAARYVAEAALLLRSQFKMLLGKNGPNYEHAVASYEKRLPLLADSGEKLSALFANLRPLAGGKRGDPENFNPVNVIHGARDLFETHNIPVTVENPEKVTAVLGYPDDLSTALVNLIGNSIYWLEQARTEAPQIVVSLRRRDRTIVIWVTDNGPGIPEEFVDSIFEVGVTLKDQGTGLGLNIARETLARSHATLFYHLDYSGGARFEIQFPAGKED